MSERKLTLAHHKTEAVMVCNRKSAQQAAVQAGNCTIQVKRSIKYLGVMIDDRLTFTSHVDYACDKAAKAAAALSRMMANSSGICASKRRLVASVVSSILRYGGPVWATALEAQWNRQKLNSTYRLMCLRVASAYRTVSKEAACVIAGMVPICILIVEDVHCSNSRGARGIRARARANSMISWQNEWETSDKGRWTHRLIPNVTNWVNRKFGEVNFYLTQFLSGHGCFRQYLHRFGHASSPRCPLCTDVEETPEHVVFDCPLFAATRETMLEVCGVDTTPDNLVERMCRDEDAWNATCTVITQIMLSLQLKWREDQRLEVN